MMKKRNFLAADLFCGAGGSSTGIVRACQRLGYDRMDLVAVNHWDLAVETHAANHPLARHFCEPIDSIDPKRAVPEGKLDLLFASPECTHHSNARGGKPINDQSRASAWCVLRWATALLVDTILIENVREFTSWGPLGANGRPLKSRRGETFAAFIAALRSLGYRVEWRVLNAANYGDPTTRERIFIQARRGRRRIAWPAASHSPRAEDTLFNGRTLPWRAAREIIDWSITSQSIFSRKRPLSPNTLARIEAGLRKFGGKAAEPFLVILRGVHRAYRSVDQPVPTVTSSGTHIGLCEPFVLQQQSGGVPRSTRSPLPTVATSGAISLVEPFLVPYRGERDGQDPRCHSLNAPMPTVTTEPGNALVEPFIISMEHSGANGLQVRSAKDPLPTITTRGDLRVCEPCIVPVNHGKDKRAYSVDRPMPTITTVDAWGLAEPFIVKYNGTARDRAYSVDEPLDAIPTKDRFGLVEPVRLDILFRMLQPRELARAMSFPDDYQFAGNREQTVKQIGNAVPVEQACALTAAVLEA